MKMAQYSKKLQQALFLTGPTKNFLLWSWPIPIPNAKNNAKSKIGPSPRLNKLKSPYDLNWQKVKVLDTFNGHLQYLNF